jgi:transcriptional regulator GlxA family with amidase domain
MAISRGILIPAAAGILDGKNAAAHWKVQSQLRSDYPQVIMDQESLYTRDDNIWTSAGISCAMDMTLAILEEDFNFSLALEVSRQLVLYYKRRDNQALYISPWRFRREINENFDGWNTWLKDHIHEALTVDRMAEAAGMSPRNFARVFVRDMGISPSKYLEEMRLDVVRNSLMEGEESLQAIAEKCGLGSEERLRRAFIRLYGISPAQFRNYFLPEQETV